MTGMKERIKNDPAKKQNKLGLNLKANNTLFELFVLVGENLNIFFTSGASIDIVWDDIRWHKLYCGDFTKWNLLSR